MHEQTFLPLFGAFGWLSIMLLAGVILRAKIKLFQKFLFPAAIIGGLIGFVFKSLGWCGISYETFTVFAIHMFTLNFISIGLTGTDDAVAPKGKTIRKAIFKGMLWMFGVQISLWGIQALVGMGVLTVTNRFFNEIWVGSGFLVPSGYAQGPGQAVALASVWEKAYGIHDAITLGLTFAAAGFLVSSLVGVPLANWGLRKGLSSNKVKELSNEVLVGIYDQGKEAPAGKLKTHSGNIDGMTFQVAILMAVYFLTYFETLGLKAILPPAFKPLAWGLMFMWGMITAVIIRLILQKLNLTKYMDNNVQRRITGVAVDYLIVATLMAIKLVTIWTHFVPILLICLLAAVVTFFFILYFGRRLEDYSLERLLAMFGTLTGTAASGLMLLRISDPDFKTPVSFEVGMMNVFSLLLIPLSFITYGLPKVGLLTGTIVVTALPILGLIVIKLTGQWKKPAW